jgi:superfamily I DNA and/or RNA helicase
MIKRPYTFTIGSRNSNAKNNIYKQVLFKITKSINIPKCLSVGILINKNVVYLYGRILLGHKKSKVPNYIAD